MGLFGNHDPAFGDRIRAAIAMMQGDTGAAARFQQQQIQRQQLELQRQEEARQQAAADRAIQTSSRQQEAAQSLGWSKDQIAAVNPADLSQLVRERFTPRQYAAGGGSTGYTNPDGSTRYEVAPWREQVGRSVVGAGANGADPGVMYRGVETVPVPNVGTFGATDLGPYQEGEAPPLGFLPRPGAPPQLPATGLQPGAPPPMDPTAEAPAFAPAPPGATSEFGPIQFGNPLNPGAPPVSITRPPRAPGPRRSRGIVNVRSAEEAARLPRGTRFRTPDGRVIVRQ